jgi:prephenate dehydrogenase
LISTPVDIISSIVEKALEHVPGGCIITDAGSTKGQLVAEIEALVPENIHFVGAHPMAGSHKTGVLSASVSLFDNSVCIITPTEFTNPEAVAVVSELWKSMGARVEIMSPQEHDFLIAAASHLPHAVACALVSVVAGVEGHHRRAIDFTATGFADTTRIAAGSPEIWRGIFMQDTEITSSMLKRIEEELAEMRKLIEDKDEEKLLEKLKRAKQIRDSINR